MERMRVLCIRSRGCVGASLLGAALIMTACRPSQDVGARAGAEAGPVVVGPNVMVSGGEPGSWHSEYMADGDPTDPDRIMVCSHRFPYGENRRTSVVYSSFDGGASWVRSKTDSVARFRGGAGDPACEYGPDGTAFFATLGGKRKTEYRAIAPYENWSMGGDRGLRVFRSPDGGRSWSEPTLLSKIDREDLKIDRTEGPFRGRMYIFGNLLIKSPIEEPAYWLIYSTDGGRTWEKSAKKVFEGGALSNPGIVPLAEVLPDGTLFFLTGWVSLEDGEESSGEERPLRVLAYMMSEDGGETLSDPVPIPGTREPPERRSQRFIWGLQTAEWAPAGLAVDHSGGSYHGRIYVMSTLAVRGRTAYQVLHSDDKGETWSRPVRVTHPRRTRRSDGTPALDWAFPQIVVNKDGVVGITWYEWQEDDSAVRGHLRFTASLDGGKSWLPSVQVSRIPFVLEKERPELATYAATYRGRGDRRDAMEVVVLPGHRTYHQAPGDYAGMAVGADGTFHAFWLGTHEGRAELYTARVTVAGEVSTPDQELLVGMDNITRQVRLETTGSTWDPATNRLSLTYQLRNTSDDTIVGPLKAHLLEVTTPLGNPRRILAPGTKAVAGGAVLDLTDQLPPGGLAANQRTRPHTLQFQINDFSARGWWGDAVSGRRLGLSPDVLHLWLEIYGKSE